MARCDTCGNDYDKPIEVVNGDRRGVYDSFECAIQALAPSCATCGIRIIGHGMEQDGIFYCCASCAARAGVHSMKDRA
jgi:hypothetical protein